MSKLQSFKITKEVELGLGIGPSPLSYKDLTINGKSWKDVNNGIGPMGLSQLKVKLAGYNFARGINRFQN